LLYIYIHQLYYFKKKNTLINNKRKFFLYSFFKKSLAKIPFHSPNLINFVHKIRTNYHKDFDQQTLVSNENKVSTLFGVIKIEKTKSHIRLLIMIHVSRFKLRFKYMLYNDAYKFDFDFIINLICFLLVYLVYKKNKNKNKMAYRSSDASDNIHKMIKRRRHRRQRNTNQNIQFNFPRQYSTNSFINALFNGTNQFITTTNVNRQRYSTRNTFQINAQQTTYNMDQFNGNDLLNTTFDFFNGYEY
jgi:hypothetical protein